MNESRFYERGKFTHFALVCFADGDARVYGYYPDTNVIHDLPKEFKLDAKRERYRVTYIEHGTDKELLLTKARMARSAEWEEKLTYNSEI